MQFRPDDETLRGRFSLIEGIPQDEIFVRLTGMEDIEWGMHSHRLHQFVYVLSGTLHLESRDMSYFVGDRHFARIPGGVPHRLSSNNRRISLMVVYYEDEAWDGGDVSVYMADGFAAGNLAYLASCGSVSRSGSPELYGFALSLLRLLPRVCRKGVFPAQPVVAGGDGRIAVVLDYIMANLDKELSLASVAAATGFSVRNLTRHFTRSGMRFVHFVNYRRVVRAIELLADGDMSIGEAAYAVGFSSPSTFSRVFRNITGEAPSDFIGRRLEGEASGADGKIQ